MWREHVKKWSDKLTPQIVIDTDGRYVSLRSPVNSNFAACKSFRNNPDNSLDTYRLLVTVIYLARYSKWLHDIRAVLWKNRAGVSMTRRLQFYIWNSSNIIPGKQSNRKMTLWHMDVYSTKSTAFGADSLISERVI